MWFMKIAPFWWAAENGYYKVIKILLEAGANPGATDINKATPLQRAETQGHAESIRLLRKAQPAATPALGCAATRRPVVIDGFISAVAALCAYKLCPNSVQYFVPSHASYEIGYRLAMDAMHLQPLFLLGMRLGEGSGCPLAFEILDAACAIINDMATFDQAGIDDGYLDEIREGDKFTVEGAK